MNLNNFSIRFKNYVLLVVTFLCLIQYSEQLYEDQIGKFDWYVYSMYEWFQLKNKFIIHRKHDFVGKLKNAFFDGVSYQDKNFGDRIIVATEQNVLAALNVRTGDILWRKIMEKDIRGSIQYLHVTQTDKNELTHSGEFNDNDIITVSGTNPAMVRGWNPNTGHIIWEWSLTPNTPANGDNALWIYQESILYHVVPVYGSHIEVTGYYATTGQNVKSTTSRISAPWIVQGNCILADAYFACTVGSQLVGVNVLAENSVLIAKDLDRDINGSPLKLLKVRPNIYTWKGNPN